MKKNEKILKNNKNGTKKIHESDFMAVKKLDEV